MSASNRVRSQRILREAEGYLELDLPQSALDALGRITEPGTYRGHQLYLTGEALRALGRFIEAADALEQAADLTPSNIQIFLALGWCYKRSNRLPQAIGALERALEIDDSKAILFYNLACYWSLRGDRSRAIECLGRAIAMEPQYRDMVGDESDFDPIRRDPDFQAITSIIV